VCCIEDQIAELQGRQAALLQKLQDGQDFWEALESTLSAYCVNNLRALPSDMQQSIAARLATLPSQSEVEEFVAPATVDATIAGLELAELDAHEAEVLPLVAHRLCRELNAAIPTVTLLLSFCKLASLASSFHP
jgi:Tfp pilus assembly protein PilO